MTNPNGRPTLARIVRTWEKHCLPTRLDMGVVRGVRLWCVTVKVHDDRDPCDECSTFQAGGSTAGRTGSQASTIRADRAALASRCTRIGPWAAAWARVASQRRSSPDIFPRDRPPGEGTKAEKATRKGRKAKTESAVATVTTERASKMSLADDILLGPAPSDLAFANPNERAFLAAVRGPGRRRRLRGRAARPRLRSPEAGRLEGDHPRRADELLRLRDERMRRDGLETQHGRIPLPTAPPRVEGV